MTNSYESKCRADCDNLVGRHGAKGLCQSHYARWKRDGDEALGPLYTKGRYAIERATRGLPEGCKRCPACEEVKSLEEFKEAPPSLKRDHPELTHSAKCIECEAKNRRLVIAKRRFGQRGYELTLMILDGAQCENPNCDRTEGRMVVDHDHSCCPGNDSNTCGNCVRGILCSNCNSGAGLLGDSSLKLRGLADYLEERSMSI